MNPDLLFYAGLVCGLFLGVFVGRLYEQDMARKRKAEKENDIAAWKRWHRQGKGRQ